MCHKISTSLSHMLSLFGVCNQNEYVVRYSTQKNYFCAEKNRQIFNSLKILEFLRQWVTICQIFCQKSTYLMDNQVHAYLHKSNQYIFLNSLSKKCQNSDSQSQFSMSRIIRIFLVFFSMHTISQGPRRHRKSSEVIWN